MQRDATAPWDSNWWDDQMPRVRAFVRRRLRPELANLEGATEIVQSACRELLASCHGPVEMVNPSQRWRLLRIAMRKVVQKHRYHAARKRDNKRLAPDLPPDALPASDTGPLGNMLAEERAADLAKAMQRLPEHYQRVIEWVHFERQTHAIAAARLGKSEDACKMLLSRAMARLAIELARMPSK
jgi:RNA polymerase sigma-70 factor, ECF subfamily